MKQPKPSHTIPNDIELRPDGEERFREAVRAAAKCGPKHRVKEQKRSATVKKTGQA